MREHDVDPLSALLSDVADKRRAVVVSQFLRRPPAHVRASKVPINGAIPSEGSETRACLIDPGLPSREAAGLVGDDSLPALDPRKYPMNFKGLRAFAASVLLNSGSSLTEAVLLLGPPGSLNQARVRLPKFPIPYGAGTRPGKVGFTHLDHWGMVAEMLREAGMEMSGMTIVGEVVADDRARIAFGRVGVRRDDRYAVAVGEDGTIVLTPLVSVPKRELIVWENQQLRESLARGLAQSAAGESADLGDFTQFADDEDESE